MFQITDFLIGAFVDTSVRGRAGVVSLDTKMCIPAEILTLAAGLTLVMKPCGWLRMFRKLRTFGVEKRAAPLG